MRPIIVYKGGIVPPKQASTNELVALGQAEPKNADIVVLRKNWLAESTVNLQSQREKDLSVFGTQGRLGEILWQRQQ